MLEFINSKAAMNSRPLGFSQVVKVTNPTTVIYVAGQGPLNERMELIGPGDIETQARETFRNVRRQLEAAGASFDDVVKMNIFVLDIKRTQWTVRKVRSEFVNAERPPASTMVEVTGLAVEGMLIEVEAVAVR